MKNLSLMTKLLYIVAFTLFVVWVIPNISTYYSNVKIYEKNIQKLQNISSKYEITTKAQKFSETIFKQDTELLFSKVKTKSLGDNTYEIHITMKKEDLKSFHTFIETISLRYYVEIKNNLEFKTEDKIINVKMILKAF